VFHALILKYANLDYYTRAAINDGIFTTISPGILAKNGADRRWVYQSWFLWSFLMESLLRVVRMCGSCRVPFGSGAAIFLAIWASSGDAIFTVPIKGGITGSPAVRVMPHPSFEPTLCFMGADI